MRISSQKIEDWLKAGIIDQTQAEQILNYENNLPNNGVIIGLYVLGSLIISLGIISVIAFNWENISAITKLAIDFAVLIGLAGAAFYYFDKQPLRFEILVLFFILLCMASIGLIGQIYNLTSPPYVALFLWSAITFLLVLYSQRTFNWFIWLAIFLSGIVIFWVDKYIPDEKYIDVILVTMFMLITAVTLYSKKYVYNPGYNNALSAWSILYFLSAIILLEIIDHYKEIDKSLMLIPIFSSLVAVDSVWRNNFLVWVQRIIATVIIIILLSALLLSLNGVTFEFLTAIQTVTILILSAVLSASLQKKFLFNFFIGLVAIRCIIFYFQALGGLATTGLGLIMVGVIILYATIMWNRHGNQLLQKIEGWTKNAAQ